jgi:SAM-dependent methyltransferase
MRGIGTLRERLVAPRRATILADTLSLAFLGSQTALDVGCGDGSIDLLIQAAVPGLMIRGVDALVWPEARIPVEIFDGYRLPFDDKNFDAVMFVDVLHHTDDPMVLLREAKRVARRAIVLKDHTADGALAYWILRFMDWVGNAHHDVALPYNYWSEQRWRAAFDELGLVVEQWRTSLGLYPWPASLVFERGLHFVARLAI